MKLRPLSRLKFQKMVYTVAASQRRALPWRRTHNPYRILVSEIMLQQTQVERVVPKYTSFLRAFPTIEALARASLGDVLRAWQGLGYNRRAKMLHRCAKEVSAGHHGKLPRTHRELVALSGIGPYTAGAILAFAYNTAHPIIETNIRTVYLHHFFEGQREVGEKALLAKIAETLDVSHPREWYTALMDYGAYLKRSVGNQNVRSKSYTKQSKFAGSTRQIRGAIVRALAEHPHRTTASLRTYTKVTALPLRTQLAALKKEGLISKRRGVWSLSE